jgi:transcriptional regulator with XRE-family HTH domain
MFIVRIYTLVYNNYDEVIVNIMELCEILKILRLEKNLTQADVASVLSITPEAYTQYERGRRQPNLENLVILSRFFKVTTDYLLGLNEYRTYEDYHKSFETSLHEIASDEEQLLNLYRKLTVTVKAEIRGELKGILRTSHDEQSATLDNFEDNPNKKAI